MYGKPAHIPIAAQPAFTLAGKHVLVVGGTAGIGRALADASAAAGACGCF
jgi:hypothetical protein